MKEKDYRIFTMRLPIEIYRELQLAAITDERSMGAMARIFIRQGLNNLRLLEIPDNDMNKKENQEEIK